MKMQSALRNMGGLQRLSIALVGSNVILAAGLAYGVVALSRDHERVVLVPPSLDKRAEIAWAAADKEYLKSFALYIATLVGNIQPKSSTVVLDSVSAFMEPRIYPEFRRQLMTLIEDPVFRASGSVISFIPGSIQYENETSRVFVTGTIITSTSGAQKYQKLVTYEVGIKIKEGRPWVSHFTSYEGSVPRTVSWYVNRTGRDGSEIPDHALPKKWKAWSDQPEAADTTPEPTDLSAMRPIAGDAPVAEEAAQAPAAPATPAASATKE